LSILVAFSRVMFVTCTLYIKVNYLVELYHLKLSIRYITIHYDMIMMHIIVAALWNRAGRYIFFLWFLLSSFSFFFPRLFSAVADWMYTVPYFRTCCDLSANLGCRSETCCTRLAEKCTTQKIAKNSPSAHHRTTLSGYIFATKARIDNEKKVVKQQHLPHMSSRHGELRPTSG